MKQFIRRFTECLPMLFDKCIIQVPEFLRRPYKGSVWRVPLADDGRASHARGMTNADMADNRTHIALTFDDGPIPEQTPWVLDRLAEAGVKATFFCVGENISRHPDIFRRIIAEGHKAGNHTHNHLQLAKVGWEKYAENIALCQRAALDAAGYDMPFFRPPHGQLFPSHCKALTDGIRSGETFLKYKGIVFWDVMPIDYAKRLSPEDVAANVKNYARSGSVLVLHDSLKSGQRMRAGLDAALKNFRIISLP